MISEVSISGVQSFAPRLLADTREFRDVVFEDVGFETYSLVVTLKTEGVRTSHL